MADEEGTLVSRRPKRSTAGNRWVRYPLSPAVSITLTTCSMELALAELTPEEPQELEEDIDFIVEKDEEDVFESDFASTDEEAAQQEVEEEDKAVLDEERRERKTARTRVEKATATAHARHRVTFNPEATSSLPKSQKTKRRVSLGVVVNAETGEVIEGGAGTAGAKRHSQRRHTVMNTSASVNRIKDAEEKRAAIPKKTKTITRLPTQDELIARALDTEEGNIMEHRNYLRLEEEKRAKARVVKQSIEGPVLRWISKKETVQVEVQLPPPPPLPVTVAANSNPYAARYSFVYSPGTNAGTIGSQPYSMPFYAYTPLAAQSVVSKPQDTSTSATIPSHATSANPSLPSQTPSAPMSLTPCTAAFPPSAAVNVQQNATPPVPAVLPASHAQQPAPLPQSQAQPQSQAESSAQYQPPPTFSYPPVPTSPLVVHRKEDVCKNYVIHEISQTIPFKPPWKDTMSAMFGDHIKWDEVKVFTGKGRPLARPVRACLVTGQPAKYLDPRTNVPFADVGAYQVLTNVLGRKGYAWSSALGCYVGVSETSNRERDSGSGNVDEASKSADRTGAVGDPDSDVDVEDGNAESSDERAAKRRKVGVSDA
ncbi:YL1 nuclear protein-domain-containing protein [Chiua virens]|nr:YL1 nuclear protein-domain-containing protein [Chiua virens]